MAISDALQMAVGSRDTTELDVDGEDLRKATLVRNLYGRALSARRPLIAGWKDNYRTLNNRNRTPRSEPWMPNPRIAEIWPVVASMTAWMTDQRPTIEVTPSAAPFSEYGDFYQQLATDMNALLNASFTVNCLDAEIYKCLWDVATYSVGYLKTVWEPWLCDGQGDAVFRRVDPFNLYPDPNARSVDQLNYIIEAKVMTMADMERSYPGASKKVGTGGFDDHDNSPHVLDLEGSQGRSGSPDLSRNLPNYDTTRPSLRAGQGLGLSDSPLVLVLECWIRGFESTQAKDGLVKVTDHWQCVVTCGAKVLLDSAASDINAFGTHPYDKIVLFDTGEWYGPCLVEFLRDPQESINRVLQAIEHNLMLMGNPMLVESRRSTSRNKQMTNKPGQRIEADPNTVAWLNPPVMQPQIAVQLLTYYQSKIESISGMSAMVRGFSPTGRNAQGVLDSVQDAAFVRIRASLREIERALRGQCSKMAATIAEFYTEPRVLSLLGPDGDRTNKILRARHFYVLHPTTGDKNPLRFNLMADAGSQLPTSKQARSADAQQLFTLGAIDVLELLKAKGWPNYAVVAKRVMNMQAQAGTLGQPPGARQRAGH